MEYRIDGKVKTLGDFGKSTRREFDEALAVLPSLVEKARSGDDIAGNTAKELLWKLANEAFNTRTSCPTTFRTLYQFGNKTNDVKNDSADETLKFNVLVWHEDEEGEGECLIGTMQAVSVFHAKALLRDCIKFGKYPKGSYLEKKKEVTA